MDASNLIKPALANGEMRCIGSTTYQGISRHLREGPRAGAALPEDRRRRAVGGRDTVEILKGLKPRFEEHTASSTRTMRCKAAAELAAQSHQRASHAGQGHRRRSTRRARASACKPMPSASRIVDVAADRGRGGRMARIPAKERVDIAIATCCENLERNLKLVIFGQDKAIEALVVGDQDGALRACGDQRKPIGSFLFCRPHGRRQDRSRPGSSPSRWASSSCASTCRNTWSGIRCRA